MRHPFLEEPAGVKALRVVSGIGGTLLTTFGALTSVHGLFSVPHNVLVPGVVALVFGTKLLHAAVTGDADKLDDERNYAERKRLREAGIALERQVSEEDKIRSIQDSLHNRDNHVAEQLRP